MDKKLQRGIVAVFIANMINVVFSLCTNFLLPKYLSVDSYAAIKTYQLYIAYVGIFHFGFVDGIYLKYGGKDIHNINSRELSTNLCTIRLFEVVIMIAVLLIAILLQNFILICFALSILPLNMNNYFKFLYQATGEFNKYGMAMNITTIAIFAINMIFLICLPKDHYFYYLIGYVCVYLLIWLYLEWHFQKHYGVGKASFSFQELITNIKDGIFLTIGNLASILLTSMDRWFVKILMDTVAFAQYSFAVSIENFLNLAITPITTTLYNFFCRETQPEKRNAIVQYVIIFAALLPATSFGVKFVLEIFLTEYINASSVVFFLFAAQMFNIVNKGVYVNLYKVDRKQHVYFIKLCVVIVFGFIVNILFYLAWHQMEAFALGTLVSSFVWYILSALDFRHTGVNIKATVFLLANSMGLIICGYLFSAILGFVIYIVFSILLMLIFMRSSLISVISLGLNRLKRRNKK